MWNICIFVLSRFAPATLEEVTTHFYGNLFHLHTFKGESHIHPPATHTHTHPLTNKHTHTISSDWQQRGYESRHRRKCAYFFHSCRVERGNDERRVVYLWEVNIDTTPARKMTGPRSRVVVRGEARLSTWQRSNSNTVPSLKAPGHCHHSSKDPRWRCFAVSWGSRNVTMIAVYGLDLETDGYRKVLELKAWTQKNPLAFLLQVFFYHHAAGINQ